MSKKTYTTFRLFPKASFLTGLGTTFNIFGNSFKFNYSESGEEADSKAIESDWGVVGSDLEKSMKEVPPVKEKLESLVCG